MKKFAKIMAVLLVSVMTLAVLVACGYPSDPDKAKEKLEAKGYEDVQVVKSSSEDSDIVATVTATKSNIKDFTLGDLTNPDKLKELTFEGVQIIYYRTVDLAKENFDNAKDNLSEKEKKVAKVSRYGSQLVVTYKLTGEDAK